jgi:DHA1 family quinolone resistance protein-like MFS transporter
MDALKKRLINLFALNVAFSTSMQMIQSLFPLYLRGLNATEIEIGLVMALGSISAMVTMIPSGLLIGKVGKKKLLLISVFLIAIPPLVFITLNDWRYIIPFFMMFSTSMSFFAPTRMSLVAENAGQQNVASLFGIMNLAWPIGGIVSPVVSGYIIERMGWNQVFIVSFSISALSLIPLFMIDIGETSSSEIMEKGLLSNLPGKESLPVVGKFFFLNFLQTIGLSGVFVILPLYLKDIYELSPSLIGLFFTFANVISLFTQIPSGYLADRFGKRRLMMGVVLPVPVLFFIWGYANNWLILLVLFSLSYCLWSMTWPPALALLSESFPPNMRGTAFGVMMTAERFAFSIGPIISGYMYSSINSVYPFYLTSVTYMLSLIPIYLMKEKPTLRTKTFPT